MSPLAFKVEGAKDGLPVVLLHAIATSCDLWLPQVAAWGSRFRLVRIDLPGHGASAPCSTPQSLADMADQVIQVLDGLGIETAAVVGISLGGMVAQAMAMGHPRRIRAAVFAHTSAYTPPAVRQLWEDRLQLAKAQGLAAQADATLARWFTADFLQASPMTVKWMEGQIRLTSLQGYMNAVQAIQQLNHLDALPSLAMPAMVVHGEHDAAVPWEASQRIAALVPNAELQVIRGAPHIGNVEQSLQFTETVGVFLSRSIGVP